MMSIIRHILLPAMKQASKLTLEAGRPTVVELRDARRSAIRIVSTVVHSCTLRRYP